jgi:Ser/Thr protein kinase RdoA (MazF antagonist)
MIRDTTAPQATAFDSDVVAGTFALGRPRGPATLAARGELGRIWRLDTDQRTWAVKELFEPMSEAEARSDVAFQLAALDANLPLPEPVLRPDGRVLAEIRQPEAGSQTVRVYTWVDLADPVVAAAPEVAAELLARLHRLVLPAETPPHPWFTQPVGADRWNALLQEVAVARPAWQARLEGAIPLLIEAEGLLPPPESTWQCCHLDFNPYNVLLDAGAQPVILDWENSGPAAVDQELAMALMDFTTDDEGAAVFVRSYEAAGGPGRLRGSRSFGTAIAVQGHLIERYARGAIAGEAYDENRLRSDRWIVEILDQLITLRRIENLLTKLAS